MQKLDLFYVILLSFPWMDTQGCSQAGQITQLMFIQQLGLSRTFIQIDTEAEILSRPDLGRTYITIHNQTKFLRISIKQCINFNPRIISCRTQSPKLHIMIKDLIDEDCMYHIGKIDSRLQYAFHSFPNHTNSVKSDEILGLGSYSYDRNRHYYYLNESNKSRLALSLSITSVCLCFIFSGLFWYFHRRFRRERMERRRRELCIYSMKKPVGQFPVIVYMEENRTNDFPGDTQPTCGICLERFCSHTRVRKLNCSHYFHVACLNSWVLRHEKCPLCRQSIFPEPLPTVSAEIIIYNDAPTDISMLSEAF